MDSEFLELERRRRELAAVTTIDLTEQASAVRGVQVSGEVDLKDTWLEERRRQCAKFEQDFNDRIAGTSAVECSSHPGEYLAVDREKSLRASYETLKESGEWRLKVILEDCPACVREVEEAQTGIRLEGFGVPGDIIHARLGNWKPRTEADRAALAKVTEFARVPRGTLLLLSPAFGVGKTHLAVACLTSRKAAMFITQSQFLLQLRAEYGTGGRPRLVRRMQETPLLVLDEVGVSGGGRDELPALHEILSHRYGNHRPTVITANVPDAEGLTQFLGARMYDRMRESIFATVVLSGSSMRGERRQEYLYDGLDTKAGRP